MRIYVFLFLVLPLYNANTSFATELSDEVYLKNRGILFGEVLGQNENGAVLLLGGDVIEAHRVKKIVLRLNGDVDKDIVTHCDMVNDDGDLNIYLKDGRHHRGRIIKKYEGHVKLFTEYSGLVYVNSKDLLKGQKQEVELSSDSKHRVRYYDVHMKDGIVLRRKRIEQNTDGDILIMKNPFGRGARKAFNAIVIKFTEIKKILPNTKPIKDTSSFRWDVVHLKNGDRIRGNDLEVILEKPLKIQMTKDSKELVSYRFDEVKHVFTNVKEKYKSSKILKKKIVWIPLGILAVIISSFMEGMSGAGGILTIFPVNY